MDYQIKNLGIGYQLIVNGYPIKGLFPTLRLAEKRAKEIMGEFFSD